MIEFTRVKTTNVDEDYQNPLGMMNVTYDRNGKVTNYTISSQNEGTQLKWPIIWNPIEVT